MTASKKPSKKTHNIFIAVLLLAAALLMTACSAIPGSQTQAEPETLDNMYYYQGEDAEAYNALQSAMVDEGKQFAAVRLGTDPELAALLTQEEPDYYEADALLRERLEKSNLTGSYPFLSRIPSMRIICADEGTDLFCVVPNETTGELIISALGEPTESGYAKGDEIVRVNGAYPVLIFADNAYIEERGGAQQSMTIADGLLSDGIMSLEPQSKPVQDKSLMGSWKCAEVHDDAGAIFDLYLDFKEGKAFEYYYIRKDGGPWENKMVMHFTGTWELMGEERLELTATADGGTYFDAGMTAYDVSGLYEVHFIDDAGEHLLMRHMGGDPFLTGLQESEMVFTKETE